MEPTRPTTEPIKKFVIPPHLEDHLFGAEIDRMEFQENIASSSALANVQQQMESLKIGSGNPMDSTLALITTYPFGASACNSDQPSAAVIAKKNGQVTSQAEHDEAQLVKMNEEIMEAQNKYFKLKGNRDLARQLQSDCPSFATDDKFNREVAELEKEILNARAQYFHLAKKRNSAIDKAKAALNHNSSEAQRCTSQGVLRLSELSRAIHKKQKMPGFKMPSGWIEKK